MLGFRFIYGMRIITPLILGMDRTIRVRQFVILNLIGAALWSAAVAVGGYLFGRVLKAVLADIAHYELALLLAVLWTGVALRLLMVFRGKHRILRGSTLARSRRQREHP